MDKIVEINLVKKLNIIKGPLLLIINDNSETDIIVFFKQLFKIELDFNSKYAFQILNLLECKSYIQALNLINIWKEEISYRVFKNPCDKDWFNLIPTENHDIKYCTDCHKNVYKVSNEEELQKRIKLEQCVAIDVKLNLSNDSQFKSCHLPIEDFELLGLPI